MTFHTPGPWKLDLSNFHIMAHPDGPRAVAEVCTKAPTHFSTEELANAKLIESAPELKAENLMLKTMLLDLRKQYDEMRKDVLGALEELTNRCDGSEGVGAEGSNIQMIRAHSVIAKYSSEPTEAQKEDVRKNGVPESMW